MAESLITPDGVVDVVNGDITLRVEVSGSGPTILCVHGWPELAHSWRHQAAYFAAHGYRVAAMDVRGYGGSSAPAEIERYTLRQLTSDVAAVAAAVDDEPVVLFGHDWGAPIAWQTAIRYPERVRAVAGLSVPHTLQLPISFLDIFDRLYPDRFFYMLHFQEPGVAEAEFAADLRAALKRVYFAASGDAPPRSFAPAAPRDAAFLPLLPDPPPGPLSFMTDADLAVYASTFQRTGMTGGFNRYRAIGLDVETSADIVGALVEQPSYFVGGEFDLVRRFVPGGDAYADPGKNCTDFRGSTIVAGAGHWVQQEAPAEVNAALHSFLESI
jgi:pimeloyl-ACP methyl ester carboxylesterase